ncbi:MAG: metal-dependent transcriptional regulator [Lachnospiraceae bacterium]|nr:metal-dependent transcriptional regulator [Bacillota bacterium]MCI6595218.1 metal-dependent transcriptional regulator [Bacillota bacterium]MDD7252415.1 metal-dependent transcriptional regulator [Bacillota bacterium]MDY2948953.1 metal-dependent transcriptional regulator [Lachnospiraceae bacterium]
MTIGRSAEDYLEAILMIHERQGYVRSTDVAEQLGISKPSVSNATKRLRESEYLTTDPAGMLVLTASGMEIASQIYARHRALTDFFIRIGVSPEQAREDACKIEHDISQETFEALCRYAGEQA